MANDVGVRPPGSEAVTPAEAQERRRNLLLSTGAPLAAMLAEGFPQGAALAALGSIIGRIPDAELREALALARWAESARDARTPDWPEP